MNLPRLRKRALTERLTIPVDIETHKRVKALKEKGIDTVELIRIVTLEALDLAWKEVEKKAS